MWYCGCSRSTAWYLMLSRYDYSHAELSEIAAEICAWMREGLDVYVMLLNDAAKVEACAYAHAACVRACM